MRDYDSEIAALDAQIADLTHRRRELVAAARAADLDAHLDRLPPDIRIALLPDYPRARDLRALSVLGLAYSTGGSSRFWTARGLLLRGRLVERG